MGAAAVIGNTSRLPELVGVWRLDVRLVKTFDELSLVKLGASLFRD